MGFLPGQKGSTGHAEFLVSVPREPEQEKTGLKAGWGIITGMRSNPGCQGCDTSGGCQGWWKKGEIDLLFVFKSL